MPQVLPEKGSACQEGFVPAPCSSQLYAKGFLSLCFNSVALLGQGWERVTVSHVDSPMHQGQAMQLPNLMEHFHRAAPLSSAASCTHRPGIVMAWAGGSTIALKGTTTMPAVETSVPTHKGTTPDSTTTTVRFSVADGGST